MKKDFFSLSKALLNISGDDFLDIKSKYWNKLDGSFSFLRMFKSHLLVYFGDSESLPVIHTYGVDGLTPDTTAYPDPEKQTKGYGMFFSVNGFKSTKRTKDNLYSYNAFFVDIDYPNKDTVPTKAQLDDFKRAVMDDLSFCITSSREDFGNDPEHAECPPPPTMIVETKNGFHVYWIFKEPIIIDLFTKNEDERIKLLTTYETILKKIAKRFQGDSIAAEAARVLRVPGSIHLKTPDSPFEVKIVHFDPDTSYRFAEMKKFWIDNKMALSGTVADSYAKDYIAITKERKETEVTTKLSSMFKKAGEQNLTDEEWEEVDKKVPYDERESTKILMAPSGIKEGRRNKCLLIASTSLRRAGWSFERTLNYFLENGYNRLTEYEIRQTVRSAFIRKKPYIFTWHDPVYSEYIPEAEISQIMHAILEIRHKNDPAYAKNSKLPSSDSRGSEHSDSRGKEKSSVSREKENHDDTPIGGVPRNYPLLPAELRKNLYDHFELEFVKEYPGIVYAESFGFFELTEDKSWYQPIPYEHVERLLNRLMYTRGLADKRSGSQLATKVKALQSMPDIFRSRDSIEFTMNPFPGNGTWLNLKSGVLDLDSGRIIPRQPKMFFTHSIDADPINNPSCPNFELFVRSICTAREGELATDNRIALLQEVLGYCLTPYNFHQVAFMFIGEGSNGKSTLTDLFVKLLGRENVSKITPQQINARFGLHTLYQKRLNMIDEIKMNEKACMESEMIKKIITGQEISAEIKNEKNMFEFAPFVKFIFNLNKYPKITDTGRALYRRFIPIPFERVFEGDEIDRTLPQKLWAERSGILRWAMEGWQRLYKNGSFTIDAGARKALDDFKEANSAVVEFILSTYDLEKESNGIIKTLGERWLVSVDDAYKEYSEFTTVRGYGRKSHLSFIQECSELSHSRLSRVKIVRIAGRTFISGIMKKSALQIPFNHKLID